MTASLVTPSICSLPEKSWQASLSLRFSRRGSQSSPKNALVSALHQGPLRVQRAFYPEGPLVPHIYLLHPPGGVVAGDSLAIDIHVDESSHGLITTPSAGRVYRTNDQGLPQTQRVTAQVESNAVLEWLPQENIVFNGANGYNQTKIRLQPGAHLMAWDIVCLGRVVGDEPFEAGCFTQSLEIFQEDQLALVERISINGDDGFIDSPWGLQGFTVFGTFVSNIQHDELLQHLKQNLQCVHGDFRLAFTQKQGFLICRYLGHSAQQARHLFSQAWQRIRPYKIDRAGCEPRIWHT